MTVLQSNTREHVYGTLQVFASHDRQRKYKTSVPFVHIPDEIIAQWDSYRELRNRDWYIKIWSEAELKSLDIFDLKLEELINDIGERGADIPEILENPEWIQLMIAANECLKCIDLNSG